MNCQEAKKIEITVFLNAIGQQPKRKFPGHWWYLSPLPRNGKQEQNPSFVVDILNNLWYDKALDTGGDLVKLVQLMHNTNTAGALQIIGGNNLKFFSFDQQKDFSDGVDVLHVQPVQNRALIQYLDHRCIPVSIARLYLVEMYYRVRDAKYFSLAFKNDRGGYALRNLYNKIAVSPAYYTTIPGRWHDQLNLFEGFFDFLSALTYFKTDVPKLDSIILNSTVHAGEVLPLLKNYKRINLFFDNDDTGSRTAKTVKQNHSYVVNYAGKVYPEHNDFNEFLMQSQKRKS